MSCDGDRESEGRNAHRIDSSCSSEEPLTGDRAGLEHVQLFLWLQVGRTEGGQMS